MPDDSKLLVAAARGAYQNGDTVAAIAKRLSVPRETLRDALHRAGLSVDDLGNSPEIESTWDGNSLQIISNDSRITTPEALLERANVDLSEWRKEKVKVRKYDVVVRDGNAPVIVEQFYVAVDLAPISPEPFAPTISSVAANVPRSKLEQDYDGESERLAVLSDLHIGFSWDKTTGEMTPFHDRKALDVALQVLGDAKPQTIVLNGDILDMTEWSDSYTKEAGFYFTTQPAIAEAFWWLLKIREAAPSAKIIFLDGNHEARVQRAITNHLLAAAGIKSRGGKPPLSNIGELLGLESIGIEYLGGYPGNVYDTGEMLVTHGDVARGAPPKTASAMAARYMDDVIFGHIHRPEVATVVVGRPGKKRAVTATCPGCLCRVDYTVPGHKIGQVWGQGFAIADGKSVQIIMIEQGKAVYNRRKYKARSRLREIREYIRDTYGRTAWKI